jgi:hypothetical protein
MTVVMKPWLENQRSYLEHFPVLPQAETPEMHITNDDGA